VKVWAEPIADRLAVKPAAPLTLKVFRAASFVALKAGPRVKTDEPAMVTVASLLSVKPSNCDLVAPVVMFRVVISLLVESLIVLFAPPAPVSVRLLTVRARVVLVAAVPAPLLMENVPAVPDRDRVVSAAPVNVEFA
jgi:hypothetical protein